MAHLNVTITFSLAVDKNEKKADDKKDQHGIAEPSDHRFHLYVLALLHPSSSHLIQF